MNKKKFLIISAAPHQTSFTHTIVDTICEQLKDTGNSYEHIDLYNHEQQSFLTLNEDNDHIALQKKENWHNKILNAEILVFVYPIWRWMPPAILKNWLDQNLSSWFAFKHTKQWHKKLLTNKKAKIIATCDAQAFIYRLPFIGMKSFWKYFILWYCGIQLTNFKLIWNTRNVKKSTKKIEATLYKIKKMFK